MYEIFVEPWIYGNWMWRGVLIALLVAIPCATLGVFLYLRRLSLISDALAHVALPGIVFAFLLTWTLDSGAMLAGAIVLGIFTTFLIEKLSQASNVRPDASIGIVFTVVFSIGVILLSTQVKSVDIDTSCVLYGNLLGVSGETIWTLGILAPLILILVGVFYRWLSVLSFDKNLAITLGIPVSLMHYGLMTAVSTMTVAGFEAVGAILVMGFIIVPAATAHRIADRLNTMIFLAVGFSVFATFTGLYISIWINCSPTGAIVSFMGVLYALVFLFAPKTGVFWNTYGRSISQLHLRTEQ